MLYIVVYVCASHLSIHDCNEKTARAYQAKIEQGIVCGLPSHMTIASSVVAPTEVSMLR